MEVQEIDAPALKARLADPQAAVVLIDVREPYEYGEGYIEGALGIPMNSIPSALDQLDKDAETVIYCAHGVRSAHVAAYLMQQGFSNVKSLMDGYAAWAYYNR
jgi:rhodanese-related sulfurtransferase